MAIRVGVIGSGFGATVHAPAFAFHPAFELVAIASPNRAVAAARDRKIPHAFASLREMLDGVELDAVSIASPPFDHHPAVMLALARGKHVLCEKPFALTVDQAQEMVAASNNAGTVCGVAHEFRFLPQRQALKELIENAHLGALRHIEVSALTSRLRSTERLARSWFFDKRSGGGIAGASLSHHIDAATWLAGRPPRNVTGLLRTAIRERVDQEGTFSSDADDGAFATIDYGDGLIARLCVDATLSIDSFVIAIHGERRTAVSSGKNQLETTLFSVDDEETSELQCSETPYKSLASAAPNLPPFVALLEQFAAHILTGKSGLPTFEEALQTQRVLATIGYGASTS